MRFLLILKKLTGLLVYWFVNKNKTGFHQKFAVKIRNTFECLGVTFVKLGQTLSMRPDFIAPEYCIEFEHCLNNARAVSFLKIAQIIEQDLGEKISVKFKHFNKTPVAVASISQVYQATLYTEDLVAVKVLRPNVVKIIQSDIRILKFFIKIFGNRIGKVGKRYWLDLIDQVQKWLLEETDYQKEAENLKRIKRKSADSPQISFPDLYESLSTKRVLVMEFVKGESFLDYIQKNRTTKSGKNKKLIKLMSNLMEYSLLMSLQKGDFHADLHPANFVVRGNQLVLLDFGLIGYLDKKQRNGALLYWLGTVFGSPELLIVALKKIGNFPKEFNTDIIYSDLCYLCSKYKDAPAHEMSSGQFLVAGINICLQQGIQFPWPIILYARTGLNMDGIILKIFPDFVFSEYGKPIFLEIYAKNKLNDSFAVPCFIQLFENIYELSKNQKKDIKDIIKKWKEALC